MQVEGLLCHIKDFTICRPYYALIILSQLSDFQFHVSIISLLYAICSMVMLPCLLQNHVFSRLLCSKEKTVGFLLHLPLCAIDCSGSKTQNSHWTSTVH